MTKIIKPYRVQKVMYTSYNSLDGQDLAPSGFLCKQCMEKLIRGKACIFIPRTKSNTKVGVRFHPTCFKPFMDEMKKIPDEEYEDLIKKAMVMDL